MSNMARLPQFALPCPSRTSVGSPAKQSLERTRWARSVRFAGRQWWRAAQLQIR